MAGQSLDLSERSCSRFFLEGSFEQILSGAVTALPIIMYFLKILAVGILFVNKSGIDIISRILIMDKEELYETGELKR